MSPPANGKAVKVGQEESTLRIVKSEGPKRAYEAFTEQEFVQLGLHLNNGNSKNFVSGYRAPDGVGLYRANKIRTDASTIKWAYDSTREQCRRPITVAVYSTNREGMSRWGALDFDSHGGDVQQELRAGTWARKCWQALLNQAPCVIFEHSGRGWHTWLVWKDFKSISWIYGILEKAAVDVGCTLGEGDCEILPPRSPEGLGKAMRLPGTYNPNTGRCSEIIDENVRESEVLGKVYVNFGKAPEGELTNRKRSISSELTPYRQWAEKWSKQFAITSRSTRNHKLVELTGTIYHQVGLEMAELLVGLQFDERQITTSADRHEHMVQFKSAWNGLNKKFEASLHPQERAFYLTLTRQGQRDKFRIIVSFARYAKEQGSDCFPISIESVAHRVGETIKGVSKFRDLLVGSGLLTQVESYRPGLKCGSYKWNAMA